MIHRVWAKRRNINQENKTDIEIVDQTNSTKSKDSIEVVEVLLKEDLLLINREIKKEYSLIILLRRALYRLKEALIL